MANTLTSFAHFESMVSKPTWKDILLDLVSSNRVDPWNIDLIDLSDAFISKVREMESMDFNIQANVILAASILLKYKSDYLKYLNYQSDLTEFPADEDIEPLEDIPQLTLSSRIPPRRQITAEELISEMEKIIKYESIERVKIPRGAIVDTVDLELNEHDVEKDMVDVLEKIRSNSDESGWSLFSQITKELNIREKVYTLLCILYLVQTGSIDIRQDTIFGEILILKKD